MAGLVVCDRCDKEGESVLPYVKAVVRVRATTLKSSTVSTIASEDACVKHIGEAVNHLYQTKRLVTDFYQIVVIKAESD